MKIDAQKYRVRDGDAVDQGKRPTGVKPVYKSGNDDRHLLDAHVAHSMRASGFISMDSNSLRPSGAHSQLATVKVLAAPQVPPGIRRQA